jgi:hypothetical protein
VAVSAVEAVDMREAEVMSTIVTAGGQTATVVFLTKRGAYSGATLQGTDSVQQQTKVLIRVVKVREILNKAAYQLLGCVWVLGLVLSMNVCASSTYVTLKLLLA